MKFSLTVLAAIAFSQVTFAQTVPVVRAVAQCDQYQLSEVAVFDLKTNRQVETRYEIADITTWETVEAKRTVLEDLDLFEADLNSEMSVHISKTSELGEAMKRVTAFSFSIRSWGQQSEAKRCRTLNVSRLK